MQRWDFISFIFHVFYWQIANENYSHFHCALSNITNEKPQCFASVLHHFIKFSAPYDLLNKVVTQTSFPIWLATNQNGHWINAEYCLCLMRSLQDLCSVTFNALCLRDLSDFLLFPGKDEILQIYPWPHLICAFEMGLSLFSGVKRKV